MYDGLDLQFESLRRVEYILFRNVDYFEMLISPKYG